VAHSPTEPEDRSGSKGPALPPRLPDQRSVPPIPGLHSGNRPVSSDASPPELPTDEIPIDTIELQDRDDESDQIDITAGPVVAVLTSATTVSFFSSATFHLLLMGTVVVVSQYLGLDWLKLEEEPQRPLSASLGDEEIEGDLPVFELAGEPTEMQDIPASNLQQLARQLQQSDAAALLTATDDVWRNVMGSNAQDPESDGAGVLLKVPESGLAVTKGSFTAFTIPANPKPREIYSIVIEVRLPDDVKKFKVSDLVGKVVGSDGYTQNLPYDSRTPYAAGFPAENQRIKVLDGSTVLDVVKNRVQIIVKVPGAAQLVKDVIRIRSRKLKEEQELTLVFGIAGKSSDSDKKNSPGENDSPDE